MPKISFLVSTYDATKWIDRRMRNLLEEQDERDIEVVIVNPNSPGGDGAIAESWAARDSRVNYIYMPEREPYGTSWLRAWEAAKGDIVVNANTDDRLAPSAGRLYHEALTSRINEGVAFVYAGIAVVDEDTGRVINGGVKPPFDREVMKRECWAGPSVGWRNDDDFRNQINWSYMYRRSMEHTSAFDYWLWLYFMSMGHNGYVIPEILVEYTQCSQSIENRSPRQNNYETFASVAEFFPDQFDTHLKPAKEFKAFPNLPDKQAWIEARS